MKKYVINPDFLSLGEERRDDCDVDIAVHITEDVEGNSLPAKGTARLFLGASKTPFHTEETQDGWVRTSMVEDRRNDSQSIKVAVEFTSAKDGIVKIERKSITIPAKARQRDADPRPRYILVLEKPSSPEQLEDSRVALNFVVRLRGQGTLADKTIRLFMDNAPHNAELVTDRAGEAFARVEFQRRANDRQIRISARMNDGGRLCTSHPQTVTIAAARRREDKREERQTRFKLVLEAHRLKVGDDRYKFIMKARCTRVAGESNIPVRDVPVFFSFDYVEITFKGDSNHSTDANGESFCETVVLVAPQFEEAVYISARAMVGEDEDHVRNVISNTILEKLPAATKDLEKPKPVRKILVRKGQRVNGNVISFHVTFLSDPEDLSSTVQGVLTAFGVPGAMRFGDGDSQPVARFRAELPSGIGRVELTLPFGSMGQLVFGAENTAVTSEPQTVKSSAAPQAQN